VEQGKNSQRIEKNPDEKESKPLEKENREARKNVTRTRGEARATKEKENRRRPGSHENDTNSKKKKKSKGEGLKGENSQVERKKKGGSVTLLQREKGKCDGPSNRRTCKIPERTKRKLEIGKKKTRKGPWGKGGRGGQRTLSKIE